MVVADNETNSQNRGVKLIRCALQDPELIEALEKYTYDKNYNQRILLEVALSKFLEDEGYL